MESSGIHSVEEKHDINSLIRRCLIILSENKRLNLGLIVTSEFRRSSSIGGFCLQKNRLCHDAQHLNV